MNMEWRWFEFKQLTTQQLYDVMRLRCDVFVVEQRCAYQDLDGIDQQSWHLLGFTGKQLVAYARVFVSRDRAVIGRIVTDSSHRGVGLGRSLVLQAKAFIQEHPERFPQKMYMMAQQHLEGFYQSLGFETTSEPYDEDGILHIDMACLTID